MEATITLKPAVEMTSAELCIELGYKLRTFLPTDSGPLYVVERLDGQTFNRPDGCYKTLDALRGEVLAERVKARYVAGLLDMERRVVEENPNFVQLRIPGARAWRKPWYCRYRYRVTEEQSAAEGLIPDGELRYQLDEVNDWLYGYAPDGQLVVNQPARPRPARPEHLRRHGQRSKAYMREVTGGALYGR